MRLCRSLPLEGFRVSCHLVDFTMRPQYSIDLNARPNLFWRTEEGISNGVPTAFKSLPGDGGLPRMKPFRLLEG